jgi:hypothetical protein
MPHVDIDVTSYSPHCHARSLLSLPSPSLSLSPPPVNVTRRRHILPLPPPCAISAPCTPPGDRAFLLMASPSPRPPPPWLSSSSSSVALLVVVLASSANVDFDVALVPLPGRRSASTKSWDIQVAIDMALLGKNPNWETSAILSSGPSRPL